MKITQIRNATMVISAGGYRILVDPMLLPARRLPSYKTISLKKVNPTVDLPDNAWAELKQLTHALITHCRYGHLDHLDSQGIRFLRDHRLPVICPHTDVAYLKKKGLRARGVQGDAEAVVFEFGSVMCVPCRHGRGVFGWLMDLSQGVGYFIRIQGEPSLYISGDTVLTPEVSGFIREHQPDILVLPAGCARSFAGGPILFTPEELQEIANIAKGRIVLNHLDALDHLRVSRKDIRRIFDGNPRVFVPDDGEPLGF